MSSQNKIDVESKILKKSFSLFLSNGYEETTIRQIAQEVGIGRGHLYYYFKKKEDILLYIYKRILNKIYEEIDRHDIDDNEMLLNYAITQCMYTYAIIKYEKLFRIYIEASKVPTIKKEYINILTDLFKKKSKEINYKVSDKDIYLSAIMACAGEEELLRMYYSQNMQGNINDIIRCVLTTRLILLNIISKEEVDFIVDTAIDIVENINKDKFLESIEMFLSEI